MNKVLALAVFSIGLCSGLRAQQENGEYPAYASLALIGEASALGALLPFVAAQWPAQVAKATVPYLCDKAGYTFWTATSRIVVTTALVAIACASIVRLIEAVDDKEHNQRGAAGMSAFFSMYPAIAISLKEIAKIVREYDRPV